MLRGPSVLDASMPVSLDEVRMQGVMPAMMDGL
jgi:hypothetical protein